MRTAFAATLLTCAMSANAGAYRCQTSQGIIFSDTPCGPNAEAVEINPPAGGHLSLETGDFSARPSNTRRRPETSEQGCSAGYIQSTRLRRYRVKNHIEVGMSEEQVRYILGRPDTHDGPWWVYQDDGREISRYRFARGCLQRWR